MKKWIFTSVLSAIGWWGTANEVTPIKSVISDVTVYTQGAQVYRKASFSVKPGISEIVIDGVCANVDAKSLQVKATGDVIILDSKYSLYYPEPKKVAVDQLSEKNKKLMKALEDSLQTLLYDMQEIQDEIDVLTSSKQILQNNGAIRGQGKVNDSIPLLKDAMEYYSVKMNEINKNLLKLSKRKQAKMLRKADLERRIRDLRNYQNSQAGGEEEPVGPIYRVTVTVSAKEATVGKLAFSYIVSEAGWTPMYDIRSDVNTGKIELTYKAHVYQNTGTEWKDVKLTISTNNPYQNKTKPELHPWYLDFNNYVQRQQVQKKSEMPSMQKGIRSGADREESISLANVVTEQDAMNAYDFTTVVNNLVSAEFRIDLPYTIKSNNERHMVLVSNKVLDARYQYYTIPKLDPSVYLVADIFNLDELQLVPAQANIFFDGAYMGETFIDPSAMQDTLSLSLGKDPNLFVKRTLVQKESKERIVNNQKEKTNLFSIEVRNNKSVAATVIVLDQLPITQNAEIVIEALSLDKADHDPLTGKLTWRIELKPKEKKLLEFKYKVRYDKDKKIVM